MPAKNEIIVDFVRHVIQDLFLPVDTTTREELIARGFKLPPNENIVPEEPLIPSLAPRKMYVVYQQLAVHEKIFGEGIDILGDIAEALGFARIPNPTFHWAILVGDYVHQLHRAVVNDRGLNYYNSEKYIPGEWQLYEVGNTYLNDWMIAQAGMQAIEEMPPTYHLFHNSCQTYVINHLNFISYGSRKLLWTPDGVGKRKPQISSEFAAAEGGGFSAGIVPAEGEKVGLLATGEKEHEEFEATIKGAHNIMRRRVPRF